MGSYLELTDAEVDRLISQCAAALRSHAKDYHAGYDKENALCAFESVMVMLLDVRDHYTTKRADIDAILRRFGYPVPEN